MLDAIHSELEAIRRNLEEIEHRRNLEGLERRFNARLIRMALMVNLPVILAAVGLASVATRLG